MGGEKHVIVHGTFDMFHSGHVAFLKQARDLAGPDGQVTVFVLDHSDDNEKKTMLPSKERKFLCENTRFVTRSQIIPSTLASLKSALENLVSQPGNNGDMIFLVNREDDSAALQATIQSIHPLQYVVGDRIPLAGLPSRTTQSVLALVNKSKQTEREAPFSSDPSTSQSSAPDDSKKKPRLAYPRPPGAKPVVFVSGCYDLLHSGHVAFFNEASQLGDLFVSIGSDSNIELLKHHKPMFPERERLAMVECFKSVAEAQICSGSGMLDFEADLDIVRPEVFFVNEDGHRESKAEACEKRGIKYVVAKRAPSAGLEARSSTALKEVLEKINAVKENKQEAGEEEEVEDLYAFPWRICLAGGWLDQPWVSEIVSGPVIVVNIHPHEQFKTRSGLATSTRQVGMKLWGTKRNGSPPRHVAPLDLAYLLFGAENPPGCKYVAGSQDALGLMLPGINRLDYNGSYWPHHVAQCEDPIGAAEWLERVLWLVPLPSRPDGYDPLEIKSLTKENVSLLAEASHLAWDAIHEKNAAKLGQALTNTMQAWRAMLPNTVPMPSSEEWVKPYRDTTYGCLFSGCGGGFLMVVSDSPVPNGFQIKVKTTPWLS